MNSISKPLIAAAALLGGCAHQIVITPDVSQLDRSEVQPIGLNVGYYIAPADRDRQVITPGGGGDKVSYYPYRELEPALFKVLGNVFRRAYPLQSTGDAAALAEKGITLVFIPTITTTSSSTGFLTWPPTDFKVELACKALDPQGAVVWEDHLVGEGKAEFSEFKSDFPLAARRAALKAMSELQRAINAAPPLRRGAELKPPDAS